MANILDTPRRYTWSGSRDDTGQRTYDLTLRLKVANKDVGPASVMNLAGLPSIGAVWAFGSDSDAWAFCKPNITLRQFAGGEEPFWEAKFTFSTKPHEKCQDQSVENPLLEPPYVSGSFVKYTKAVTKDRNGDEIRTSSHELITGPLVEFDHNRAQVSISLNSASLGLATVTGMMDHVNDSAMWGVPTRCVKLSSFSWSKEYYGQCFSYYKKTFGFDIDFENFDRKALDEGRKVLRGDWNEAGNWVKDPTAVKTNPRDFIRYKDVNGENTKALLDGNGEPVTDPANVAEIDIEYYDEANLLSLGIPSSL